MWWEVITEALLDTLKLFPFLLLLYILIELMEHNTKIGKANGALCGKAAPVIGAATGLVPMCGFSVMAAKLYRHRHLTLGTLLAVFIATSDEAFIVLLLSPMVWSDKLLSVLALCGSKLVLGIAVGYLADLLVRKCPAIVPLADRCVKTHTCERTHENEKAENAPPMHVHAHDEHGHDSEAHHHGHEYSVCEHKHGKESNLSLYFVTPLVHSLKIAAFILLFNLAFGFLFFGIGGGNAEAGEERVITFLQVAGFWYQPLVCGLIGLVPNCASSVALAETYALGGIAFGSLLCGLVVNAGLGYLVLLRDYKKWRETAWIVVFILGLGIAVGYAANAIGLLL